MATVSDHDNKKEGDFGDIDSDRHEHLREPSNIAGHFQDKQYIMSPNVYMQTQDN